MGLKRLTALELEEIDRNVKGGARQYLHSSRYYSKKVMLELENLNQSKPVVDLGENPDMSVRFSKYLELYKRAWDILATDSEADLAKLAAEYQADLTEAGVGLEIFYSAGWEHCTPLELGARYSPPPSKATDITIHAKQNQPVKKEKQGMANCTLQEVKAKMRDLENDMLNKLRDFEEETGCKVSSVALGRAFEMDEEHAKLHSVQLQVEIR